MSDNNLEQTPATPDPMRDEAFVTAVFDGLKAMRVAGGFIDHLQESDLTIMDAGSVTALQIATDMKLPYRIPEVMAVGVKVASFFEDDAVRDPEAWDIMEYLRQQGIK